MWHHLTRNLPRKLLEFIHLRPSKGTCPLQPKMQSGDDFEWFWRLPLDHPWSYRFSSHFIIISWLKVNQKHASVFENPLVVTGNPLKKKKITRYRSTDHYLFSKAPGIPIITISTFAFPIVFYQATHAYISGCIFSTRSSRGPGRDPRDRWPSWVL